MGGWNVLPDEITEVVLARLPMKEISRLRTVCKEWNYTTNSSTFKLLHRQLHPRRHLWLFVSEQDFKLLAWKSSDCKWIDFKLPSFYVRNWVSAGGLVCVRCHWEEHRSGNFFVGNPLTGLWKELPHPNETSVSKTWVMTNDSASKRYKIILLQYTAGFIDVYDSKYAAWSQQRLPEYLQGAFDSAFSSSATSIGEVVYCIHGASSSAHTYDTHSNMWKQIQVALPSDLALQSWYQGFRLEMPPKFVEGPEGEILLLGAVGCPGYLECVGVIWKLENVKKVWREVARAPSQLWMSMLEDARERREPWLLPLRFVGQGNQIFLMTSGSLKAITYNIEEERWGWVDFPQSSNCLMSLCFNPSLQAKV
eukprot:c1588_g1_i1 orf=349-1443(-)